MMLCNYPQQFASDTYESGRNNDNNNKKNDILNIGANVSQE
jgi:hypothetical protein